MEIHERDVNGRLAVGGKSFIHSDFSRQLERELNSAKNALKLLHDDTADYVRVNHLGKVHHNKSMKQAALVLGIPLEE